MTYQQTLDYLYSSTPAFHLVGAEAYKPGLSNTLALMEGLGNPHRKFKSIHIAGTNGKGSTSHLIAAALQSAGLKVGLYTSPHLVDYRERIRLNGEMISKQDVVDFVEKNKTLLETIRPSFFEATMALAFSYFAQQQVDIAVVEVGLGGLLDSTNIITPLLSVITNIGFDHTEFLGKTLALIAKQKAGIIKPHVPVVIGETNAETAPVFVAEAKQAGADIIFADRQNKVEIESQLNGIYQQKNIQTAYYALLTLNSLMPESGLPKITEEVIKEGFAHVVDITHLRGRWEKLQNEPLVICDTGHNSHGIKYVVEQLRQLTASLTTTDVKPCLRIVFGMVNDKDVDVVLSILPKEAIYYITQANTQRAIQAEQLCLMAKQAGLIAKPFSSISQALKAALADSLSTDIVFAGGSNYVVAEVLQFFDQL